MTIFTVIQKLNRARTKVNKKKNKEKIIYQAYITDHIYSAQIYYL